MGARRLALGVGAVTGALALPVALLAGWARLPGPGQGRPMVIDVHAGGDLGEELADLGVISSPRLFRWYVSLFGAPAEPGEHVLNDALSPRALSARLARTGARPATKVKLPEGLSYVQTAERLEQAEICSAHAFAISVRDPRLRQELGVRAETLEGLLFPATYDIVVDSQPANVARLLVRTFRARYEKLLAKHPGAREALQSQRGWGEHEITTLASIVEKEAALDEEKPTIASVYLNRLDDSEFKPEKMLQADPTAAYGCVVDDGSIPSCSGFRGRVTPLLLRDPTNRYNTYKHPGLPPGPIANPGEASIEAVLEPAQTDYLFFVATGNARHTFSRTLDAHNRALRGQ